MKHYKSVFENEQECIKALLEIHNDGKNIECDPMYFKGNFYKEINKPKYKFDLNPQVPECKYGDATNLQEENERLKEKIENITTKKGTTYERNGREKKYDAMLWTRFNSENTEKLKKIADEKGISLSTFVRKILEDYLESEVN